MWLAPSISQSIRAIALGRPSRTKQGPGPCVGRHWKKHWWSWQASLWLLLSTLPVNFLSLLHYCFGHQPLDLHQSYLNPCFPSILTFVVFFSCFPAILLDTESKLWLYFLTHCLLHLCPGILGEEKTFLDFCGPQLALCCPHLTHSSICRWESDELALKSHAPSPISGNNSNFTNLFHCNLT